MMCCNSKDLPRSHLFVPAALDKLTAPQGVHTEY